MLTKNVLGYSLGDFFTNSSGHPGRNIDLLITKAAKSIGLAFRIKAKEKLS
jgi:hypothetical protein